MLSIRKIFEQGNTTGRQRIVEVQSPHIQHGLSSIELASSLSHCRLQFRRHYAIFFFLAEFLSPLAKVLQ